MEKREGTSQTFGQLVIVSDRPPDGSAVAQTSTEKKEGSVPTVSLAGEFVTGASSDVSLVSHDVSVKIVEDAQSPSTSTQTAIAMAAAASDPVAVVAPGTFTSQATKHEAGSVSSVVGYAAVVASTQKSAKDIKEALTEAAKFDLNISMHSKRSESLQFNSLKVPNLEVSFVYNFFDSLEEDAESQEDQSKDPLLMLPPVKIPRYANLAWEMVGSTEHLAGTAVSAKKNREIRTKSFATKLGHFTAGSSNFAHSVAKQKKRVSPLIQDGVEKKIVDLHDPELAFASIANNALFANSLSVIVSTEKQSKVVSEIPFKTIKKP